MKLTKEELKVFILEQKRVFDIVRLVDVSMTTQYMADDNGEIKKEPYRCYAVWNKGSRCENCISAKALALKSKLTKFEFVDNEVSFALAVYTEIEGTEYVIELVSKLNDETLFGAYGKDNFINSIESYNKKIYTDSLTGAYNRQYYNEQLRKLSSFNGVAMIDIDNFKSINDTYGHFDGDIVLKEVVKAVMANIRSSDVVIRLGGDEFLLVFQEIPKEIFVNRLESIRQSISNIRIEESPDIRVSISMGAVYSEGTTINLIDIADKALYKAKEQKNKIVLEEI